MTTNYYLDFENKFRGERQNIIDALSMYDPLIEKIVENCPSPKLIDIGCGRGEWLQKWKYRFDDVCGIEFDKDMIRTCRENHLNVIEGDAIDVLTGFENQTVEIITIFHLIEHLEHHKLLKLLIECERVLNNDGVLIMETPNIDSLLVSTKSFHLDPTHINPIHSDLISFDLESIGFTNVKTYDIHCGPLQSANPRKITRVLNGVSQDLCIIATKQKKIFQKLMLTSKTWEKSFKEGITTLQAAVEYDLELEALLDNYQRSDNYHQLKIEEQASKLSKLEKEILILKSQLKIFIYIFKILKFLLKPIINILRNSRKLFLISCNNIFNILVKYKIMRDILISKRVLSIINFLLKLIKGPSSINAIQIQNKFNKLLDRDTKFILQNKKLSLHYKSSLKSKFYKGLFTQNK
tara:strand:+ start:123 stop:1346 length:1224 start_codon:yes stop_codon:yes gene_type:complete